MNATTIPATAKQAALIADLMKCPADQRKAYTATITANRTMKEASARIKELLAALKANGPIVTVAKGEWHFLNGDFFLVAKIQNDTRLYAKKRNLELGGFDVAKGVIFKLSDATRVNASHIPAIQAYAQLHDTCIFCSLPLDLPESRTAGYGEKCASNQGLPWGN